VTAITFGPVLPILRFFDLAATRRFYLDYLGCGLEWQEGEGDRPIDLEVSRGALRLHQSCFHGDGTPGTAVLIETIGVDELHEELGARGYPFLNPGIGEGPGGIGREMTLIDPASNLLRFFQRPARPVE
jgi:ribosomal-protein-alanine N-acetyltransferase